MSATVRRARYRRIADRARRIPADHGLRQFAVYLVEQSYDTDNFRGSYGAIPVKLTNYGGSNPRVRSLNSEERALGNFTSETVEIGPITPSYASETTTAGTALTTLAGDLAAGSQRYLLITGPGYSDPDCEELASRFVIRDIETAGSSVQSSGTLRYMITAERVARGGLDEV